MLYLLKYSWLGKNKKPAFLRQVLLNLYLVVIVIVVFVIISIVVVTVIVCKIPFGIMNKPEPIVGHFKEKVSYPEIEVSVNVNPFVFHG